MNTKYKRIAEILLQVFFGALFFAMIMVFSMVLGSFQVHADSFYPSGDSQLCEVGISTSISYAGLPNSCSNASCIEYSSGDLAGESGNYSGTHTFNDLNDITYPDAHRYAGIADHISVPPLTTVNVGFYVNNYSGHGIDVRNAYLFTSRANPADGDWTRLGAGGSYGTVDYIYQGVNRPRDGKYLELGNLGFYDLNDIFSPPPGSTVYSFTTIQPIEILSRAAAPEFNAGNLRIRYDLTVRNNSVYQLNNIHLTNNLPSGEAFDQYENFAPNETKTITYYANFGTNYPLNITTAPTVVHDPNRHLETAAISIDDIYDPNPEGKTILIDRTDLGAPSDWTARQPDFTASPSANYQYVELIPYTIYSNENTVTIAPEISIDKLVSDSDETLVKENSVTATEIITYDISISNTGARASGVTVVDDYDQNLIQVVDPNGGFDNGDTITWNVGDLHNNANQSFYITASTRDPGAYGVYSASNNATISSTEAAPESSSAITNIYLPNLKIEKQQILPEIVSPGQVITYVINYENIGEGYASDVVITDYLPEGVTFISFSENNPAEGLYDEETDTITWELEGLSPSESGLLSFIVVIDIPTDEATLLENRVTISSDLTDEIEARVETSVNRSCCLGGYVWNDDNGDQIKNHGEEGIENIRVTIEWDETEYLEGGLIELRTDQQGHYESKGLPYLIPITVTIHRSESDVYTERLVLLPPSGAHEDYYEDGIHYITADGCINSISAAISRNRVLATAGIPIVPRIIGTAAIILLSAALLFFKKPKRKPKNDKSPNH